MTAAASTQPRPPRLLAVAGPEWAVSDAPVPYQAAMDAMEARVAAIRTGAAAEQVWLLEHPPTYTAGTSATTDGLKEARFPAFRTGRGGQWTYHGPGQRTAYVMLDLARRDRRDVRAYVEGLETWLIRALDRFGVRGERRPGRVGIWVAVGGGPGETKEAKIAAIGVRVTRWVTWHGVALNLDPDLSHYDGIVPCGIAEHGVTSLARLGVTATLPEVDAALMAAWSEAFGWTAD